MSAIIYWQNPCKLPMIFRGIKAYMLAFSGSFSRKCLVVIFFNFFVCFIFNVSLRSAPKRKNFDIQHNTRVASGGQFTLNYHTPSQMLFLLHRPNARCCPFSKVLSEADKSGTGRDDNVRTAGKAPKLTLEKTRQWAL